MRFVYLKKGVGKTISLADGEAHHLKVMRLKSEISLPGICDQELYTVRIAPDSLDGARLLSAEFVREIKSPVAPIFLVPLIEEDRLRFCVEKLCELGAAKIQFYISDHTTFNKVQVSKFTDRMLKWENLVRSSCQQCGNHNLPQVFPPVRLSEWVGAAVLAKTPEMQTENWLIAGVHGEAVSQVPVNYQVCLIGPEGDFSESEYFLFQKLGLRCLRFEHLNILRTETAIISLAALKAFARV